MTRSNYEPGDFRDTEVVVHRAGAIGALHVPTFSISAHTEMPDRKAGMEAVADSETIFEHDASQIADALIGSLPGGTLDRLVGKLLAYKASHFIVNHETPRPAAFEGRQVVRDHALHGGEQ